MKKFILLMLLCRLANATDILLTWETPTEREDGSQIEQLDRYNLYPTFNSGIQDVIEIPADATSLQLPEVEAGYYTFRISSVERHTNEFTGETYTLEGEKSEEVSLFILNSAPKKITITIQAVE